MCCAKHSVQMALSLLLSLTCSQSLAQAASPPESPLTRIARTGKLTAGTRTDAAPFAHQTPAGWTGYSIDLLERIRAMLQRQLQRPVQLELVDADTGSVELLSAGNVDIVCGSTSYSQYRELQADFSVSYFVTGTQLLINTEHELGTEFTIGVIAGTTNQQLMQKLFPIAQFVTVDSRAVGLRGLETQRFDALASDGILLEAMRLSLLQAEDLQAAPTLAAPTLAAPGPAASAYEVVPDQPYDEQFYACLLPQGDAPFRQLVNSSLLAFMQGVLAAEPEDLKMLETWFGANGQVPISPAAWSALLQHFQQQLDLQTGRQTGQQTEPTNQPPPSP